MEQRESRILIFGKGEFIEVRASGEKGFIGVLK
jgi:hypothetical protein